MKSSTITRNRTDKVRRLSLAEGAAYAAPIVPVILLLNSLNVIQGIYAKHFGIPLAVISAVMFAAGLFDAVSDSVIGYLSDRHTRKTGDRRRFVLLGLTLSIPCAWFLLVPSGEVTIVYFAFWYIAFYLAVTLVMIPHLALGSELTANSDDRARAYGFSAFGRYAGLVIFYLVPLLPFFATTEITPETLRYSVLGAGLLTLPCLYMFWRTAPKGGGKHNIQQTTETPWRAVKALAQSGPFRIYMAAFLCFGLGTGVFYGLLFLVTDSWLQLGDQYVFLYLFHLSVALLLIRPAVWATNVVGKRKTWGAAVGLALLCFPVVLLLLSGRGPSLIYLYVLQFLLGASSALGNVAIPSLMGDVIDYGLLRTRRDRCATCFAAQSFLSKISTTTIGFPLGGAVVAYFGFDPADPVWTDRALFGFQLALGWMPALIFALAALLIFMIPLDRRRRAIIRQRLDALATRRTPLAADRTQERERPSPF